MLDIMDTEQIVFLILSTAASANAIEDFWKGERIKATLFDLVLIVRDFMSFLNKHPVVRVTFFVTYLATAVWIVVKEFAWLNIFFSLLMLFGCYVALVKSGVIKDKKTDSINELHFDVLSIVTTVFLVVDIFLKMRSTGM